MKLYVGVTDGEWFRFLRSRAPLDEVNFWQPGGSREFRALDPGDVFLFKLHRPEDRIAGGGIFAHATRCPLELAWDAFGPLNGVPSLEALRARIAHHRRVPPGAGGLWVIGCVVLRAPFFLPEADWLPPPADFAPNVVQGKTYDATAGTGRALWEAVQERLRRAAGAEPVVGEFAGAAEEPGPVWGAPALVRRRLGQGSFRLVVTDAYERRCAMTGERALPVLQAAHIRPVSRAGQHRVDNGLLLRSDVHTLFDLGYLTVTPGHRVCVSGALRRDFENGEQYCQLQGKELWLPRRPEDRPNPEYLEWHADTVFRG